MRRALLCSLATATFVIGTVAGAATATAAPAAQAEPVFTQPSTGSSIWRQLTCSLTALSAGPTFPSYPCWYNPIPS